MEKNKYSIVFLFTCSLYDNTFTEGCPGASICPVKAEHEERTVQADSNEDSDEKAEIVDFAVNKVHQKHGGKVGCFKPVSQVENFRSDQGMNYIFDLSCHEARCHVKIHKGSDGKKEMKSARCLIIVH